MKFIALSEAAKAHFWPAAVAEEPDEGVQVLETAESAESFLNLCGALRFWDRAA